MNRSGLTKACTVCSPTDPETHANPDTTGNPTNFFGPCLGYTVCVTEYTEQFRKNNSSVVLTPTKRVDQDPYFGKSYWEIEEEDWQTIRPQTSQSQETSVITGQDAESTTPKAIDQPVSSHGGAQKKTGFPTGVTRPSAVISGQPARFGRLRY